jgi:hypothetical protein
MTKTTITQEAANNINDLLYVRTNNDHYRAVLLHLDWASDQLGKVKGASDDYLCATINDDLNELQALVCRAIDSEAEACNKST